ncbi:methyl-accepting chemotaxis protein [Pseudoalteromonas arctica]|uniref:Methyl-accepting chemotaxis protein n=1 Tax=Pseudoalteromonas arctica TaxID=394751 RepID=A0A7Y0DQQ7_9GAMM|nr:methyl-accepting chemotaxis protein [Pseudoalteromonas arctica]NMM39868.1 methyl-accepting chemotaxis protein [Pseudoalteromonas arctica]
MTIRSMLRIVFAAATIIAAGLLVIILLLKQGLSQSEVVAQQRYDVSHLARLADTSSTLLTNLARQHVVTLDPSYKQGYNQLVAQRNGEQPWLDGRSLSYVKRLQEYHIGSEDLDFLTKSTELSVNLIKTEMQAFKLVEPFIGLSSTELNSQQQMQWLKAVNLLTDANYINEAEKIKQPVVEFLNSVNQKNLSLVNDNNSYIESLSYVSLFLVAAIIIILIICYLQLEKRVIRTTSHLVNEAQRIASGDLSRSIKFTGNDEISMLSESFNSMVTRLSELLSQISKQSHQAQVSATELDQISQHARNLNDKQSQAIEVISSSVYENSTAVKEVSHNCVNAANSAREADEKAQESIIAVRQGIQSVEEVARILSESITHLTELEKSVTEVTAILNVISNIAEQTNLLALNAAIEAARAGEQGRGFAVVADEVRTLASRTQHSTVEIKNKIESLQTASNAVTNRIRSSDKSVKQAVTNSEKVGEMLEEISQQVALISDVNRTIASASEEQAQVTEDIAERLTQIQDSSLESQTQTHQISTSSSELAEVANNLNSEISKFKLT